MKKILNLGLLVAFVCMFSCSEREESSLMPENEEFTVSPRDPIVTFQGTGTMTGIGVFEMMFDATGNDIRETSLGGQVTYQDPEYYGEWSGYPETPLYTWYGEQVNICFKVVVSNLPADTELKCNMFTVKNSAASLKSFPVFVQTTAFQYPTQSPDKKIYMEKDKKHTLYFILVDPEAVSYENDNCFNLYAGERFLAKSTWLDCRKRY